MQVFISSTSSLSLRTNISRERLRQLVHDKVSLPEQFEEEIQQPMATELYHDIAGKIDQHNWDRQPTLAMEKKIKPHDWAKRVNLTILSMCLVDAWKAYSLILLDKEGQPIEAQKKFYAHLAAELIDNNYDGASTCQQARADKIDEPRQLLLHPRTG
jgi:hypothetical protein